MTYNPFESIEAHEPDRTGPDRLIGKLLALRPIREETGVRLDPALPARDITVCYVIEVTEKDDLAPDEWAYEDHGEVRIMWTVVRRQLAKATSEIPWVMGRPMKAGRSYILRPPNPQEAQWCKRALAEARRLYTESD